MYGALALEALVPGCVVTLDLLMNVGGRLHANSFGRLQYQEANSCRFRGAFSRVRNVQRDRGRTLVVQV